jgi:hypothetical protein
MGTLSFDPPPVVTITITLGESDKSGWMKTLRRH